jgi:type VI secretion system protein ImpJ
MITGSVVADAHSIPDAIQWYEGMLLSPQHFQQADLRSNALRAYTLGTIAPFAWGLRHLRVDPTALEAGRFCVLELEAVMPDGLIVLYPGAAAETAPPLELDVKPALAQAESHAVAVHLTVVAERVRGSHVANGGPRRFRDFTEPSVHDANTGDVIDINRLLPDPALGTTDGPLNRPSPASLVSLPLAVLRSEGQRCVNSADYEPPRLFVQEDTLLFACAKELESALTGKVKDWADRLRGAMAENQAAMVADSIVTLRSIVRGLPRLSALLKTGWAPPFEVYLALCDIAGELALVGDQLVNPSFEAYCHADPLTSFRAVAGFINDALNRLHTPYTSEAFERVAAGKFELTLRPSYLRDDGVLEYLRGPLVIGVRARQSQSVEALREWFLSARIGAVDEIATLDLNRSAGALRTEVQSAPSLGVLPQPQTLLFSVATDPELLADGQTLQISLPPDALPRDGANRDSLEPDELRLFLPLPDPNARLGNVAGT